MGRHGRLLSKSVSIQIGICCRQVGILKHHRQQKAKPSKNKHLKTKKENQTKRNLFFSKKHLRHNSVRLFWISLTPSSHKWAYMVGSFVSHWLLQPNVFAFRLPWESLTHAVFGWQPLCIVSEQGLLYPWALHDLACFAEGANLRRGHIMCHWTPAIAAWSRGEPLTYQQTTLTLSNNPWYGLLRRPLLPLPKKQL